MLKLLARLIAPDRCIICNTEGAGVCDNCRHDRLITRTSSCYLCNALTDNGRVCARCQWRTPIRRVNTVWRLDKTSQKIIYALKYDGREDVAKSIAYQIATQQLPKFDLITYVPDTISRKRDRGFVAPQLVARELARYLSLPVYSLLSRYRHSPQVGAGRKKRWEQIKSNFKAKDLDILQGQKILLIDDVITTGATLTECAKTLKSAGSGTIYAATVARK